MKKHFTVHVAFSFCIVFFCSRNFCKLLFHRVVANSLHLFVCYGIATDTRARSPACAGSRGRDYPPRNGLWWWRRQPRARALCLGLSGGLLRRVAVLCRLLWGSAGASRYIAFPPQLSEPWTLSPRMEAGRAFSIRSHKCLPK